MTIPDFQTIMLPLLRFASDGKEHSIHEAVNYLAVKLLITEEEQSRLLASGQQPIFYNRVGWARTYLKKSGLVDDPRRGYFRITDRGRGVLDRQPDRIDMNYLREFPEYLEFRKTTHEETDLDQDENEIEGLTPEEALEENQRRSCRRSITNCN